MKHLVSYNKTADAYSILYNGEVVAQIDPLVTETDAKDLVKNITDFLRNADGLVVVIQNDGDSLGLIVDVYSQDEHLDSCTIWFEDYIDYEC